MRSFQRHPFVGIGALKSKGSYATMGVDRAPCNNRDAMTPDQPPKWAGRPRTRCCRIRVQNSGLPSK